MNHHGGDIIRIAEGLSVKTEDLIDFSSSINPLGFPSWTREEISKHISSLIHYPDISYRDFISAAASFHGVSGDMIYPGNGAAAIIDLIPGAIKPDRIIIPVPSFGEYERSCRNYSVDFLFLKEADNFALNTGNLEAKLTENAQGKNLVFIGNPNNPTAGITDKNSIMNMAEKFPKTVFCIDESFMEFNPSFQFPAARILPNIIIIRSMTKFYALPGLRIGYCIARPEIIHKLKEIEIPWSVNSIASAVGTRAFSDTRFRNESVSSLKHLKEDFTKALENFRWLKVFSSRTNFFLVKITGKSLTSEVLYEYLLKNGIIIRRCGSFRGLGDRYFRLAVKTEDENRRLVSTLGNAEKDFGLSSSCFGVSIITEKKKTPALMIQGTSSNAGKSIITAGLCRILYNDGIRVAPFKAQNMSLNSAVTPDGLEIGRAQALQAAAAGIDPDVRMNPLLLKPSGKRGSDIILSGTHSGFITSENWFDIKKRAKRVIEESYDSLSSEYDVIILEGAGSPAEINLKSGDIVNMAMARYAEAGVLITGDIDRGGVYASFIGTMEIFEEWERDLVKGFIVNKFRGDKSLLENAHNSLLYKTGKPVTGVIPYFHDLNLPEEDSVSFKERKYRDEDCGQSLISIGIIDLPSISNFTDFDPFYRDRRVSLTIINKPELMHKGFDALIIPGSKNVIRDLVFLKEKGYTDGILKAAESGRTEIIGICGGFQMLGKHIHDPEGIESDTPGIRGLGLLDIDTVFYSRKQLKNVNTVHKPSGIEVSGYEIHHGRSTLRGGRIILGDRDNILGAEQNGGKVWGTYLHGIFETDSFRNWFVQKLAGNRIQNTEGILSEPYDINENLDKLADIIRENMDIKYIKKLIKQR